METYKQYTWWLKAISGADEVQARRFAGAIALEKIMEENTAGDPMSLLKSIK